MADLEGINGAVTLPAGMNLGVIEWQAVHDVSIITRPPKFGEDYEGASMGPGRITGSLRGKPQYNAASTKPYTLSTSQTKFSNFSGTATLTAETGCTITGTFLFHTISLKVARDGPPELTCNFRNSGNDLGITWDEVP